jgi:hypothetical protein
VLVSGEPDISKSRLVQTPIDRLAGEPHTRLRSFWSPRHQGAALRLVQLEETQVFHCRRVGRPADKSRKCSVVSHTSRSAPCSRAAGAVSSPATARESGPESRLEALRPSRALLVRIPLGLRPSLHRLRSRSPGLVRRLRRYYGGR